MISLGCCPQKNNTYTTKIPHLLVNWEFTNHGLTQPRISVLSRTLGVHVPQWDSSVNDLLTLGLLSSQLAQALPFALGWKVSLSAGFHYKVAPCAGSTL